MANTSSILKLRRISAFTRDGSGGNPAGVAICPHFPSDEEMQAIAAGVGYSETAFLCQTDETWQVRYFSPLIEVPFCGHATIASGAALGMDFGPGDYHLQTRAGVVHLFVDKTSTGFAAKFKSTQTRSRQAEIELLQRMMAGFGYDPQDLNPDFPPHVANAGANHLILVLREYAALAAMNYQMEQMRRLFMEYNLLTVNLLWQASGSTFHARNPFPPGGVYEDPATGAAAAAFGGYLRDIGWIGGQELEIFQGAEMGCPSRITLSLHGPRGSGVLVGGETVLIQETK